MSRGTDSVHFIHDCVVTSGTMVMIKHSQLMLIMLSMPSYSIIGESDGLLLATTDGDRFSSVINERKPSMTDGWFELPLRAQCWLTQGRPPSSAASGTTVLIAAVGMVAFLRRPSRLAVNRVQVQSASYLMGQLKVLSRSLCICLIWGSLFEMCSA